MTEPAARQARQWFSAERARLLFVLWLVAFGLLLGHNVTFWRDAGARLDTDLLALLPRDSEDVRVDAATRHLADAAAREVVILVGARDWDAARRAADAAATQLGGLPAKLQTDMAAGSSEQLLSALRPRLPALINEAQREWLANADAARLSARAMANLHQPVATGTQRWLDDPLGLGSESLLARTEGIKLQARDGRLALSAEGRDWVMLRLQLNGPAFGLDGENRFARGIDAARAAAQSAVPHAEVIAAGVPLFAEAAATQASREMNTVGWGSLAAVMLVMWLAFRSLRPLSLVVMTLVVGCMAGLSACALVFGKVHILTLVFGASLVGVAEDFGIHYFASRQHAPADNARGMLQRLFPPLLLALVTSVLAYGALAIAPFPGLRQMALFSAAGLTAAFLSVYCVFPMLDRGASPRLTRFAQAWAASRLRWPAPSGRRAALLLGIAVLVCAAGLSRLTVQDDIRALQGSAPALRDAQQRVSALLGLPSPAQFLIVRAATPQALLQTEEALKPALQKLVTDGQLGQWRAVSDWVPSLQRQQDNAQRFETARATVLQSLAESLGLEPPGSLPVVAPLTPDAALAGPLGDLIRPLWLGEMQGAAADGRYASLITLSGLTTASLPALQSAVVTVSGVRLVDKPAQISVVLKHYRIAMGWLLVLGCGLIWIALWRRFGARSWRALAPTWLAGALALAVLGAIGQPLQLFHLLALFLVVGMGVDYGIFLLEHPAREDVAAWQAVGLGAVATLMSFGLLALSQTPALAAFGLVMAIGISTVWLTSPMFCTPRAGGQTQYNAGQGHTWTTKA